MKFTVIYVSSQVCHNNPKNSESSWLSEHLTGINRTSKPTPRDSNHPMLTSPTFVKSSRNFKNSQLWERVCQSAKLDYRKIAPNLHNIYRNFKHIIRMKFTVIYVSSQVSLKIHQNNSEPQWSSEHLTMNKPNFNPTPRDSNRPVWHYQRIYDVLMKSLKPQPQERICHSTELVFHKTEFQSRTLAVPPIVPSASYWNRSTIRWAWISETRSQNFDFVATCKLVTTHHSN